MVHDVPENEEIDGSCYTSEYGAFRDYSRKDIYNVNRELLRRELHG